jgi:8-oxo-dGTP pyrophosphatase MutT (NUDIX family)
MRLPKGHIEPGERPEEAALREVREESGLQNPEIVAALGHQTVEFEWKDHHYIRDESYYLMTIPAESSSHSPEKQFERKWLSWEEALGVLTFEAEREWVRRARSTWQTQSAQRQSLASASRATRLQYVSDQDPQQADDNPDVEQQISIGE